MIQESHKRSRHAEGQFSLGVSALGVNVETCHNASNSVAIRHCSEVEDLVQNVIGPAAARTYPVVGFSRKIRVPGLRENSGEVLWTRRYRSSTKLMRR